MNKIILRCWNNNKKEWYFYGEDIWSLGPEILEVRDGLPSKGDLNLNLQTNLKDKWDIDIYFNDIVKVHFHDPEDPNEEFQGTAIITETMSGGAGILFDWNETRDIIHAVLEGGVIEDIWDEEELWTIEKIGNIYENLELLNTGGNRDSTNPQNIA